jgi:uncharacterized membrane protein
MDDAKKSNAEPMTQSGKGVIESFEKFERGLWNFSKILWLFTLLLPIGLTAIVVGLIALIQGPKAAYSFVIAAIATATLFGRFIILFGQSPEAVVAEYEPGSFWYEILQELSKVSSVELFLLVMYLDLVVAAFLAFHLGFIFKVPYVGPKIADLMGDTQTLLNEQPWVKRASVFALILFVIFPTSTTGSVGGSIFGRLMGLSRMTTFGAIALGSFLGNGLMYLLAEQINHYVDKDDWWLKFVGIVFCLLLVIFLERRYRHMQNVARKERELSDGKAADET